mmetsp:Transcript_27845/g.47336  ORF Transcript_27845/g.47336 Transcript_27845/m.47336 type:complete len:112 (+) Transcript_27845:253-588(+)
MPEKEVAKVFTCTGNKDLPEDATKVSLDSCVTVGGTHAFRNCEHLKEIKLNQGLLKLGGEAFWSCTPLQNITLPPSASKCSSDYDNYVDHGIYDEANCDKEDDYSYSDVDS